MSATLPKPTLLPQEEIPSFFFMRTVEDSTKPYPRMRLYDKQWVPVGDSSKGFLKGIEDWNIKCSRGMRASFPVGTTFVADKIEIYKNCYNVPDDRLFALVKNGMGYPVATKDMAEEYERFKKGEKKPVAVSIPLQAVATTPLAGSLYESITKNPAYSAPSAESGFYVDADTWHFTIRNLLKKENTMIIGPTGCGKTAMVKLLAERLKLPLSIFDMGAMHDPITGLLGTQRLVEGETIFDYSRFSQVIQQPGIVLLDEISRPAATCNNILFPLTDDRRELPIEIAESTGARNIKAHPECVFVATANVGNEYSGTFKIDRGLLDRFPPTELDYMPASVEAKVLVSRTGISVSQATAIANIAEVTRKKARAGELSTGVSHPFTLKTAELVSDGFALLKSMERVILPLFEGSNQEGERSEVRLILAGK